jgi:hypothetical protein
MAIAGAGAQAGNDVYTGTGSPEGVVTADIGTVFLRQDGAAGTCMYIKETGTGATGWKTTTTATGAAPDIDAAGLTAYRSSLPRYALTGNLSALTTQVMLSTGIYLRAGDVVTSLTFVSATTAASVPTNWWYALYSNAATPALLSQSADQLTAAWTANTPITLALGAPQTITTAGIYYASIMVKATTPPTLAGVAVGNAAFTGALVTSQRVVSVTSGSALTGTAPATIATPTTVVNIPVAIAT